MKTSLRVLLVSPLPPPVGGIATWTRILLGEIKRRTDVEIVHLDTAVRWRAVTQMSTTARLLGGTAQALRDYLRFRTLLRRAGPDAVHICTSAGFSLRKDLLMLRASAAAGVRAVIHYRMGRIPALAQSNDSEWNLLRRCTETAATSVVLDQRSKRLLLDACRPADVRSLPNMVDVAALDAVLGDPDGTDEMAGDAGEPGPPMIVYVGHVLPSKGVSDLVDACRETGAALRLDVVGPYAEFYRRELDDRSGSKVTLTFHGTLSHEAALRVVRRSDVFALPSHSEGFPNVVAEAMACGRAVLVTDVGAMREMIAADGPEPCGICVAAKHVPALAAALRHLIEDAGMRAEMGSRGRKRAETEYAAPVVTTRLVKLWQDVAGR